MLKQRVGVEVLTTRFRKSFSKSLFLLLTNLGENIEWTALGRAFQRARRHGNRRRAHRRHCAARNTQITTLFFTPQGSNHEHRQMKL